MKDELKLFMIWLAVVEIDQRKRALRTTVGCCSHAERTTWLEPISKSSEEDDEASELDEAEEVLRVILPAHKYAALPLDPGEEAFHQPPSGVSSESAPVLRHRFAAV